MQVSRPERPLSKSYEPQIFEKEIYEFWENNGCFEAADENAPGQKSFCIVIPPPNVTGALHIGHALTNTIQDILVRHRRMKGDNALWLPGTDHAGIATQSQVEKAIRPKTRYDLGRPAFLERMWEWKEEHGGKIKKQLRSLGASLDWKRERFTLDEGFSRAVREVFVRLHSEGLIYRGERLINWSPLAQTALSDLEVIPTEKKGHLWNIRYPVVEKDGTPFKVNGEAAYLVIATTRPETLLGDTAVAIHPEDERYLSYHDKFVKLPLVGKILPILTDTYVDPEFGTGGLKITPAHDFNDYELGKKHGLPFVSVIGKDGKITSEGGLYAGLKVNEAREKIVEDLKTAEFLVKIEDIVHKVGLCQRTQCVVEPILSLQWFVKIKPLAEPALEAVKSGETTFTPKNYEKIYFEWMNNIQDWCISRQLWWGHQIPAWHCEKCEHITVAMEAPTSCAKCGANASSLNQDEDVLDTWFSSGLWPFGTLGWPEKTKSLATFYPTSILETGNDILFFWVARMMMMGIHFMGKVPFHKIYLHAMVRDEKGEKMSKTKGNVIDPLEQIESNGADSLRFTLAILTGQGRDIKLSIDRVEGYRAFCNKLWNSVKFFHFQWEQAVAEEVNLAEPAPTLSENVRANAKNFHPINRFILSKLQGLIETVETSIGAFELNVAAQAIYDFVWHEFCDWYLEFSKFNLRKDNPRRLETLYTLHYVIEEVLKVSHPIIPFVTEELWESLPWAKSVNSPARDMMKKPKLKTLMLQKFPEASENLKDLVSENEVKSLKQFIDAIRNFRGENNLSFKVEFPVQIKTTEASLKKWITDYDLILKGMTKISSFEFATAQIDTSLMTSIVIADLKCEILISLKGLVNVEEEMKRVEKDLEKTKKDDEFIRGRLSREDFVAKAPPQLIEKEKSRLAEIEMKQKELEKALARLIKLK